MAAKRKYPVGIQSFESIRKDGYIYVDKTALIYKMITEGMPYFLSRPRRFGKSLLISTLAAVFEGRRDLFEAFTTENGIEQPLLFIAQTDWRWEKHAVIRFDFSAGDLRTIEQLDTLIDQTLKRYEKQYGITAEVTDANIRMQNLLRTAHEQTGRGAVVLVDEYDNFILHSLGDREKTDLARSRFQNVFGPLKEMDDHLKFVFITGISKFSQMGVFSKLNQLQNISMLSAYESICGITEEELTTQLHQDVEALAAKNDTDYEGMLMQLKDRYDGYHFSRSQTDIYNPFSLFNALKTGELNDYWFDRGTSSALIALLAQMPPVEMAELDGRNYPSSMFDLPFEGLDEPLPILYQSGYLTILDYDREFEDYTLGFPNKEVRRGFADCLYRHVAAVKGVDRNKSGLFQAYKQFSRSANLENFIEALKSFFAGIPYHLERSNQNEHYYHSLLYTLLVAFGADVRAEDPMAKGRSDITLLMPKGIYIMELKYDHSAQEALEQINQKGYADKYRMDGRPIIKVGISFSSEERNITEWVTGL